MNSIHCFLAGLVVVLSGCASSLPTPGRWEYMGGPYARDVSTVLVDARSADTLYAGVTGGALYRSSDAGATWSRTSIIASGQTVRLFEQDPEYPATLYACTDAGLFVSFNGGKTWDALPIIPGATVGVRALAIDPLKTNVLYAGLEGRGIFKSINAGRSWTSLNGDPGSPLARGDVYDIRIDMKGPDKVYAAVAGLGIMRSGDGGSSWARLTGEYMPTSPVITRIMLHPRSRQTLVYATNVGSIYRSSNEGESWSPSRTSSEGDGIYTLAGPADNPDVLYAGGVTGVLISSDFGTSWAPLAGDLPHLPSSVVASGTTGNLVLYAFGEALGLQRSTDAGLTWQHADRNLGGSTVTAIGATPRQGVPYAVVGGTILTYHRKDGWVAMSGDLPGGEITSVAFDPDRPSTIYATTSDGALKSSDGGASWRALARGVPMTPDFIDIHPWIHTRMFISGNGGLFVSTNTGASWSQIQPVTGKFHVRSLTFRPTNAGFIYGATAGSGVIETEDGGFRWESTRYGLDAGPIALVSLDTQDPHVLYAWPERGGGFRSTNSGVEWNRYVPPWRPTDTVRIAFDRSQSSGVLALVNSREIFYSATGGGTWVPVPGSPLPAEALCISWDSQKMILHAGTRERGVYRMFLAETLKDMR